MRKPTPFGPWLLLDRIAVGGMAEVFVAVRAGDRPPRLHALKRMLAFLADDAELVTMFLDEARVWAQLAHPSILPLRELGREDGVYYIAYEYLPGKDLRAVQQRLRTSGGRLPVPVAVHVAVRVADALDHAHRRRGARGEALRVVHNDVSPGNVLIGFDGSVRIIDFGIARAALRERSGAGLALRGKFAYLSPEAVRGLPVDRRADVFSLGVVLHEMLTGERLFSARSELATLAEVRNADVPPPSARRPELPPGLDAVVLRALAREPEQRYRWAGDLRDALLPYAAAEGGPALARLLARTFPSELRQELARLEQLQDAGAPGEEAVGSIVGGGNKSASGAAPATAELRSPSRAPAR
jgi:serine/threonine-protein kinase